jgi:3-oxoacyl-[acyl-carrier protein] reductase
MAHTPTALITGAGSAHGIGFATASLLARNGYMVLLCGHSARVEERAETLRQDGHAAESFAGDLTNPETRESLGAWVKNTTDHIDALVINHGMTSVSAPMEDTAESGSIDNTTAEAFEMSLSRNLTSSYAVTKLLIPLIRASKHGRIVAVSSVTGGTMAMAHEVSYAAAKAGLEGMVRALAVDEAHQGIAVNAVAPGWIATESQTDHEKVQGGFTPMKRSGTAEDVAAVIGFLASPQASYITGQVIVVDGGNSIAEERSHRI